LDGILKIQSCAISNINILLNIEGINVTQLMNLE